MLTKEKERPEDWEKMRYIAQLLLLTHIYVYTYSPRNDQEAYQYCCTHKNSFIAIVWPIAQGHDHAIKKILNTYGTIKYQKKVLLNYDQAYHLLHTAHPHIRNIAEHVNWYFPAGTFEKPARIFIVICPSTEQIIACKHAIRKLFSLQYRSIHVNDTHLETISLAKFFFT
ncbi:MAG: hypothetical protein WC707_06715 [Candidatus Babeliaceae bacterium]|jgi:hypothetical protein